MLQFFYKESWAFEFLNISIDTGSRSMPWEVIQESRTSITEHINCKPFAGKCTLCVCPFKMICALLFLNCHSSMVHKNQFQYLILWAVFFLFTLVMMIPHSYISKACRQYSYYGFLLWTSNQHEKFFKKVVF